MTTDETPGTTCWTGWRDTTWMLESRRQLLPGRDIGRAVAGQPPIAEAPAARRRRRAGARRRGVCAPAVAQAQRANLGHGS